MQTSLCHVVKGGLRPPVEDQPCLWAARGMVDDHIVLLTVRYKRSMPLLIPVPPPSYTTRVVFLKHGYTLKAVILDLDSLLDI